LIDRVSTVNVDDVMCCGVVCCAAENHDDDGTDQTDRFSTTTI